TGPAGDTGPTGATGAVATTTSGFASNSSATIIAILTGALVPFPNSQNLSADIVPNGANTQFTINTPGRYFISYRVNTTVSLLITSRLMVNGSVVAPSVYSPALSVSSYSAEVVINIAAGDTIAVQLVGALVTAVLLAGSGATLTIIRLSA
ncbi:C1q domain-containing protein, partial [Dendrosporobacter quercicolus]